MNGDKVNRNTTIKLRLYPSPEQAAFFDKTFASCRWLWNATLADEQEFFAATDKHFLPTPARYKKEAPFLKEVDSQALVTVHQNLRRAFQDFFDGKSGYPQFKPKYSRDAYTVYCQHYDTYPDSIRLTEDGVRLPKVGNVRANLHRRPLHWWTTVSATVSRSQSGSYYCSLLYSYDAKEPEAVRAQRVGDAEPSRAPTLAKAEAKLAAMEEKLHRMERGSKNYEQQRRRLAAQREHIANIKSERLRRGESERRRHPAPRKPPLQAGTSGQTPFRGRAERSLKFFCSFSFKKRRAGRDAGERPPWWEEEKATPCFLPSRRGFDGFAEHKGGARSPRGRSTRIQHCWSKRHGRPFGYRSVPSALRDRPVEQSGRHNKF